MSFASCFLLFFARFFLPLFEKLRLPLQILFQNIGQRGVRTKGEDEFGFFLLLGAELGDVLLERLVFDDDLIVLRKFADLGGDSQGVVKVNGQYAEEKADEEGEWSS